MMAKKPVEVLESALNSPVIVRHKGGREIRGDLQGFDIHMNLILRDAEELKPNGSSRKLGTIILRGDNVVFVSP